MIYNQFDIVKVPFPFTDKDTSKKRPSIVLSSSDYQKKHNHHILAMITSAKNSAWSDDISIIDLKKAGLPTASFIRMKIFTLDVRFILEKLGYLAEEEKILLAENIKKYLPV
ncbi:MAG: type II toxin-antitoxin system PemK/MazF family toxin [Alphaproteobacteria bacterium]|nr:type II toxin-antitoxin system PemK/MazF family toxin [Alphaproteobacteria bacterium]